MPAKKNAKQRSRKSAPASGAVRKPAAPKASAKTSVKASKKPSLTHALAAAAWAEADDALAEALIEFDALEQAADEDGRAASLAMLAQALNRAARRRGLTRIGRLGAREPFDAAKHELAAPNKAPKLVRVTARGVARGAEVLRRPRVGPLRRKKVR